MSVDEPATPVVTPAGPDGLTRAEVEQRHAAGLVNTRPPSSGRSVAQIVRANLFTRINAILAVLFTLVIITGSWTNGAFGLLIVVNSGIGIVQELRARRTLNRLAVLGESKPRIRRAGEPTRAYDPDEIVVDDLVEVGRGDQVLVDGELVSATSLEVDESLLTGENEPVAKAVGDEVLSGSHVVAGSAVYRATRVGARSHANKLTAEANKFSLTESVLMQGINKILRVITFLLVPVAILSIVASLQQAERDWRTALLGLAGALVPMVPEGLVLMTSMAFFAGVIRLGRRQCLVQELPAIEGLARVDVVCADKTGTLTENGMRVADVITLDDAAADRAELHRALAALASADPSENASMAAITEYLGQRQPGNPTGLATDDVFAFTSARKFSGIRSGETWWLIGAPDVLAAPGSPVATRAEAIGSEGLRVLLVGRATEAPTSNHTPPVDAVALVVLEQRVRPDASPTIDYFDQQGVRVKVISGDNAVSVGAVARSVGIGAHQLGAGQAPRDPVDARTLPEPGDQFDAVVNEADVFGRVSPEQKRQMVHALQHEGHTVAMTGDGVNDVLALKDAQIGVAMGSGSAAARGVAQIVLLDNKFATLPHVVGEGRRVIGNIERVANLFLTKTVYSVLLALLSGIAGLIGITDRFPFVPIHVTITGWFTIGIPAFFLAMAPNNERARPGFVTRVMRLAIPAGIIVGLATFTTWLLVQPGNPGAATDQAWAQASTAALVTQLTAASWVLAVVARPFAWWKVLLVAGSMGFYVLLFNLTWLHPFIHIDTGNPAQLLLGVVVGLVGAALVEVVWWWRRAAQRREDEAHAAAGGASHAPNAPHAPTISGAAASR
ncbi:HAD-IC family P-type ATPase [Propionibacteriaceae bacterium G57]|uniref:HAD-IC family P-type ATPase n=1 Tax=Aestuariimicrobium sp. G57 TaxID=3418485 RepID=UPI003DA732F9